jgi:hypothetical protein
LRKKHIKANFATKLFVMILAGIIALSLTVGIVILIFFTFSRDRFIDTITKVIRDPNLRKATIMGLVSIVGVMVGYYSFWGQGKNSFNSRLMWGTAFTIFGSLYYFLRWVF